MLPPGHDPQQTINNFARSILHRFSDRRLFLSLLISMILLAVAISALVPRSSALTGGGSITAFNTALTEHFNTLASSGTSLTWTDNSTIPGWYSSPTAYTVGTAS